MPDEDKGELRETALAFLRLKRGNMLNGEYLLVKKAYLMEYAMRRFVAKKNVDTVEYQDFSANRYEQALAKVRNIYNFDGINATIKIDGPLSVDGPDSYDLYCGLGGCSYLDIIDAAARAAADVDPAKGKVFIEMHTPGGTVDGCDKAFQALWTLSESHQIIVENMGLIASGGQWLASAAHKIIAKTPVAFQGSIGVVVNFYDFSGMFEEFGIEEIIITNFESPDKWPDLKTEKGKEIVIEELNGIYGVFKQRILKGRDRTLGEGVVTEKTIDDLRGRVLIAEKAIEIKLADGLEDSSASAIDLADTDRPEVKTNIQRENKKNENAERGKNMDLTQILDENPKAKAQFVEAVAKARDEGAASVRVVVDKAMPIIQSDAYPAGVKTLAFEVIQGSTDIVALTSAVAAVDAVMENGSSATAKVETATSPETPPSPAVTVSDRPEIIETLEDYDASVATLRKTQGIPVETTGGM